MEGEIVSRMMGTEKIMLGYFQMVGVEFIVIISLITV